MTRAQWKDAIEGVGVIAIIASLVFVGIETRNSTRQSALTTQALEITAYQELMTNIEELNILSLQSDPTAAVMRRLWEPGEDLEEFRQERALYLLFRHGDMAYFLYERGAINEERLRSAIAPINISNELIRGFWDARKSNFAIGYQKYMDDLLLAVEE
jgi:hypothetical protein